MLTFIWDWLFDFLPWKVQVAILGGLVLLVVAAILFAIYG